MCNGPASQAVTLCASSVCIPYITGISVLVGCSGNLTDIVSIDVYDSNDCQGSTALTQLTANDTCTLVTPAYQTIFSFIATCC